MRLASMLPDQTVSVMRLATADRAEYAAFLDQIDEALIYYSLPFRSLLEDLLACESEYWLARQGGQITGVLPLMWKDGPLGRVINSLPFYGSNGGVLAITAAAEEMLVNKFSELASMPDVATATWICHPLRPLRNIAVPHDLEDERIGQWTPLDGDGAPERRLAQLIDGSARRNVRKAEASGVKVFVDNDRLDFLEQLHRANMAHIGGRPKPPAFFAKLPRHLAAGKDYRLYVAERSGSPVAALLLLYFHRTVEYYIPATAEAERGYQPTALLLWQALQDAAREGYRLWNWGGTWLTQTGVSRFKKKWGARDHPYRYFVKVNSGRVLQSSAEDLSRSYPGLYVVPYAALSG
jgi:CelD/BcsL family acetyltransferase involved in cellulose biosynthesis